MQTVDLGATILDQFPIYEPDGWTKITGETVFTVVLWRDGVEQAVPYTITEIGTSGEYVFEFTPDAAGKWVTEVGIDSTHTVYGGTYIVEQAPLTWGFAAADDETDVTFSVWLERDGQRQLDVERVAAIVKLPTGVEVQDLGDDIDDNADGVFTFSMASIDLDSGQDYYLDVEATRAGLTWHTNLGFAKV
jgi:hypothetical protein